MTETTAHTPDAGDRIFPKGFWWGTATAGHQIEGNNTASNWWTWEQQGLVNDGTRSGRACDYWNRWRDDHEMIATLGHNSFRLGIEWSRIEPRRNSFDEEAIDQYVAMLSDLAERGIKVCLTLNHWVLPSWFADDGGWVNPQCLRYWERFVRHVVPRFAPYVDLWVTLNEPMVPVMAGYLAGYHPPAHKNPVEAAKVFRALLAAHAMAYRAVHDLVPTSPDGGPTMVGYAAAYQWVEPYHEHGAKRIVEAAAARTIRHTSFGAWDQAVRTGRVPPPMGRGQRIAGLAGSADFIGVNYYMRISVKLHPKALSNVTAGTYDCPPGIETTEMGWQVYPPGFRKVLNHVHRTMGLPVWITENGCCDSGDDLRRRYLLSHIAAIHDAIADGCDIRGYLQWTLMDNFEWREGFEKRFGLVEMDHDDPELRRRPRPSAFMYRRIIESNGITPAIVAGYSPGALDRWG